MKHFVIFFHGISFFTGISAITLSIVAYIRYKNDLIKYYSYFLVSIGFLLMEQTVTTYKLVNNLHSNVLNAVVTMFSFASCSYLIYVLPLFFHKLMLLELWEKRKKIYKLLALIPIVLFCFNNFLNMKLINLLGNSILFSVILYNLLLFLKYNNRIEQDEVKSIFKILFAFTVLFFPYMFLDTKTDYIKFLSEYFPYGLLSVPIFYFVWNSVSIYYVLKYLKEKQTSLEVNTDRNKEQLQYEFYTAYNITNREQEVISLLLKGYSYKKIGEELFISLSTVKTHIRNIYQKTEVNNKIELLNLLNTWNPVLSMYHPKV